MSDASTGGNYVEYVYREERMGVGEEEETGEA